MRMRDKRKKAQIAQLEAVIDDLTYHIENLENMLEYVKPIHQPTVLKITQEKSEELKMYNKILKAKTW